jgi:mRNA interferase MazF
MKRGDVWMVDFGAPSGPEQAGRRPAVVMQDDALTAGLTTVLVIPLTTNLRRLALACTVKIPAGEAGLERDSVALCHQLQARGKARLETRLGALTDDRFAVIQDCVLDTLGV